jgi:hypothetical protein
MAEFLYLYRGTDPVVAAMSPRQMQDYMQRFQGWIVSLTQAGKISSCGPLAEGGRTMVGPKASVTDGPTRRQRTISAAIPSSRQVTLTKRLT